MKKILLGFLATILIFSCNHFMDVDDLTDETIIHFQFGGEITCSEELLTKAITNNDLILLQIYRGDNPYASGAFDNTSMNLHLKKGDETYRVEAFIIKDGKNSLFYSNGYLSETLHSSTAFYSANPYTGALNRSYNLRINYFYYNSVGTIYHSGGTSNDGGAYFQNMGISTHDDTDYKQLYLECSDWLYGEAEGLIANTNNDTWNVDFKRVGFKIKYELSGVTDGEVTVKIFKNDFIFFENTITSSSYESSTSFYAFRNSRDAWLYSEDYSENVTVAVSWKRGIGVTQDLGSTTVQVKRNCLNNIKIKLGSDDQSAGVSLSAESESSIGAEGVTIPVQ